MTAFVPGRSDYLLFVHVAAAFLFFGAAITVTAAGVGATRARRAGEAAVLARLAHRVNLLLLWPSLVILVGAGAQLASKEDVYARGWLHFGVALTVLVAVLGGGLAGWLNRRRLLVAAAADPSDELDPQGPVLTLLGTLSLVLLVVVLWLMTAKPGIAG